MMRLPWVLVLLISCAAVPGCRGEADEPTQAQRISLDDARGKAAEPVISPDTRGAIWTVTDDARAIKFGHPDVAPLLTLACNLRNTPATLTLVRHTLSRPGQKALLPVIGNGTISRFKVDAALADGEWRWEGRFLATDPQLDVFTGPRELEATMPGGGTVRIGGSRIPGEFVNWCRAGGRVQRAEAAEAADAAADDPDQPTQEPN